MAGRKPTQLPTQIKTYFEEEVENDISLFPNVGGGKEGRALSHLLNLRTTLTTRELGNHSPELLLVFKDNKGQFHQRCRTAYNALRKAAIKNDPSFNAPDFPTPSELAAAAATNTAAPTVPTNNAVTAPTAAAPPPTPSNNMAASADVPPPTPGASTAAVMIPSTPAASTSTDAALQKLMSTVDKFAEITAQKTIADDKKWEEAEARDAKRQEADEKRWKEAEAQREKDRQLALERDAKIHAQREEDRKLALERDAKAAKERNELSKATSTALGMAKTGIAMVKSLEDRVNKLEEKEDEDEDEEDDDINATQLFKDDVMPAEVRNNKDEYQPLDKTSENKHLTEGKYNRLICVMTFLSTVTTNCFFPSLISILKYKQKILILSLIQMTVLFLMLKTCNKQQMHTSPRLPPLLTIRQITLVMRLLPLGMSIPPLMRMMVLHLRLLSIMGLILRMMLIMSLRLSRLSPSRPCPPSPPRRSLL